MLKIMTYNILEGTGYERAERLDIVIDVVHQVEPDILAIQEANHFDNNDYERLKKLSGSVGLPYYALALGTRRNSGRQFHVATLSRYPFKQQQRLNHFYHASLRTAIQSDHGLISIVNAHLHPHNEEERKKEVNRMLGAQKPHQNTIILGDLNALSPHDSYEDLLPLLPDYLKKSFTKEGHIACDAITVLLNAGYHDTAAETGINHVKTMPTPLSKHARDGLTFRIDYVFVSSSLKNNIQKTEVLKSPVIEKASDHYPYWIILDVDAL